MSTSRMFGSLLVLGIIAGGTGTAFALKSTKTGSTYCLPGEKTVCTLGPPEVCHCVASTVSKKKSGAGDGATGVGGNKNSSSGKSKH
jgi:hypothetical protein